MAGFNVGTAAHKANFFDDIGKAYTKLASAEASLKDVMIVPFATTQSDNASYEIAVCYSKEGTEGFNYMPAVAVSTEAKIPDGLSIMQVPQGKYAVFTYKGPASGTGDFRYSITTEYFPKSTLKRAPTPNLEINKAGIDPNDPNLIIEEWYPIL